MSTQVTLVRDLLKRRNYSSARTLLRDILDADPDCRPAALLLAEVERAEYKHQKWQIQGKRRLKSALASAVPLIVFLVWRLWPDPANQQIAQEMAERTYAAAQAGNSSSLKTDLRRDNELYGRILSFRVVSSHPEILRHPTRRGYFNIIVESIRERARLVESVEVRAGQSRSYGYVNYVTQINKLRAAPR